MRRAVIAFAAVFVVLFLVRGLPFLTGDRPAYDSTPTLQPLRAEQDVTVGPGQEACVSNIRFGPDARFVRFQLNTDRDTRPTPPIGVTAQAPGYRATGRHPAASSQHPVAVVPIRPASREVMGTLCLRNQGRRAVPFLGVPLDGRDATISRTTVANAPAGADLTVSLLASPSASFASRLGPIFDHVAAFRPVTGWEVWILALVLLLAVPAAIAFALGRAADEDDSA